MTQFKDKVVLITGGTSGIGKTAAIAFAQAGAKVVIAGRRHTEGKDIVQQIQDMGHEGLFITTDVAQESDIKQLVEQVIDRYGRLDIAFNNAGVEQDPTPLTEQTEDTFDRIMDVNVKGVWLSLKHEIPAMLESGGGAIVNTSSIMGLVGGATVPIYNASKHAVEGLTKSVALEYAKSGIRINAVSPGPIQTAMFDRFAEANPEAGDYFKTVTPMGRIGQPDEVVNTILWLTSDSASYVTGQSIAVDGGFVAQ